MNEWMFDRFPILHSLLTFGLDRQVEHHLFPRLRLRHLHKAEKILKEKPKRHVLGVKTLGILFSEFGEFDTHPLSS